MRRIAFIGIVALASGFGLSGCVMGAPDRGEEPGLATQESALEVDPTQRAAPAAAELEARNIEAPTAVQVALAEAGPECDGMCAVREWVSDERYAEAREALESMLDEAPADVPTVVALATVDIRDEEFEDAYALTDNALRSAPENVQLMEQRARASLLAHDVETATEDYGQLIDTLQQLGGNAEVCDALTQHCMTPVTKEAHAWVGLATAEYNRGNLDEAHRIATEVLADAYRKNIDRAYSDFLLALVAAKRGDESGAMTHYEAVLSRFPNEASTLNNIGGIHYRAGDLEQARTFHEAAFESAGKHRRTAAIAWTNVGEIDMLQGDLAGAEDKLLEALEISKRFAAGHFNLAILYDISGKTAAAQREMKRGLALDEQGVTRWNMSWFNPSWDAHFKALVADAEGRTQAAKTLWARVANAKEKVLQQTAERHLNQR